MAFEQSRCPAFLWGVHDLGSETYTAAIDSAFVFETSGDAYFARFVTPVAQSSGALTCYAYVGTVTGSPTFGIEVRNGPTAGQDKDRPESAGSTIGTPGSDVTLTSSDDGTWVAWTVSALTLTAGEAYYIILKNTHGTPASNHSTFILRSFCDIPLALPASGFGEVGYTTNGFTGDPTISTGSGAFVIKFDGGELLGQPYVDSITHASNANDRGFRVQLSEDTVVSGVFMYSMGSSAITGVEVNAASGGANLVTGTVTRAAQGHETCRWAPVTFVGGTAYDVVLTVSGASTLMTGFGMGEVEANVPTDVKNCRPQGAAHVTGATPGSYTVDTSKMWAAFLFIDNNPAIAGGGSCHIIGG